MGITKRGPVNDPSTIITSWAQFTEIFGGYIGNSDFPLLCKRALDRGALLRVNRIVNYTDITDPATITADTAVLDAGTTLSFSAALVTSNTVNLTIDGIAITQAFATDNDTTFTNLIATLNGNTTLAASYIFIPIPATGLGSIEGIVIVNKVPLTAGANVTLHTVTGGASQATITVASLTDGSIFANSLYNTPLFQITVKNPGEDGNYIIVSINTASNGSSDYFNLAVTHLLEPNLNELYENLIVDTVSGTGAPANASTYLSALSTSKLIDYTYLDADTVTGQPRPLDCALYAFDGGDGSAVTVTDYVGDSAAKTGFHAFDAYSDAYQICVPELSDDTLHVGGAAYAAARKDLLYLAHLDNSFITRADLTTERDATNIDTRYAMFFAGGLKVSDPQTGVTKSISEMGDVIGLIAYSDTVTGGGEWMSFAGKNRGFIPNALGVVNNFGGTAQYADIDLLAKRQINMVVNSGGTIYLNSNFTAQLASSRASFADTMRFVFRLSKELGSILQRYLQEPLDLQLTNQIYDDAKVLLDDYLSSNKRALLRYLWVGGQNSKSLADLFATTSNTQPNWENGIYEITLQISKTPALQVINCTIKLTPSTATVTVNF
jgi:hypothetical protein